MSPQNTRREDWIIGVVGVLLLFDLIALPWHTAGGGTVAGITLPTISDPATGSPDAALGVLAWLATLAVVLDLLLQHVSPQTQLPAIGNSRSMTRFVLAVAAATLLALKFIFNITDIGNLGVGFWLGAVLTSIFLLFIAKVRYAGPAPAARAEEPAPAARVEEPAPAARAEEQAPAARAEEPAPTDPIDEPAPAKPTELEETAEARTPGDARS